MIKEFNGQIKMPASAVRNRLKVLKKLDAQFDNSFPKDPDQLQELHQIWRHCYEKFLLTKPPGYTRNVASVLGDGVKYPNYKQFHKAVTLGNVGN